MLGGSKEEPEDTTEEKLLVTRTEKVRQSQRIKTNLPQRIETKNTLSQRIETGFPVFHGNVSRHFREGYGVVREVSHAELPA